jgi:hypothetical protein
MPLNAESIQLGPWTTVRYDIPVEEVKAHELSDMDNTRIGTGGQVEQRPGHTILPRSGCGERWRNPDHVRPVQLRRYDTDHEVIVAGDKIYDYSSSVWTDRTNSLTVTAGDDNTFEWADANGVLVATNGVDTDAFKISGGVATALDDNARFTKGKHIAWFDNRLWIGNVNGATYQLWYSDTADIETWGATSFFNFGGIITGLVPTQNALTVHTTDGIYTLYPTGNATLPYTPQKATERAGLSGQGHHRPA